MIQFVFSRMIILAVLMSATVAYANTGYSIAQVRSLYGQGVEDEAAAKKLLDLVIVGDQNDPLLLGYRGGAEALLAKHAWNPYAKLDYLDKSMKTLQRAIDLDPQNTEIRFIRFSIQFYVPRFLGLSKNLKEDAHVIALHFDQLLTQLDENTLSNVGAFMIKSGYCSTGDIKLMRRYL
jgi:tetratricopeptide (TPR) repeat protein